MKQELKGKCFEDKPSKQLMYGNKYAKGFTLMSDLSSDLIQKCERMTRTEDNYLVYLRNKRVAKLVGIQRATLNEDDQEKVSWDATSDYKYVPVQSSQETFNASIYIFAYFAYIFAYCKYIYFAYFVVKLNYLYGYLENPRTHRECLCRSDVKTFQNRNSN